MGVYTFLTTSTGEDPPQVWYSKSFSMVVMARTGQSTRPLPADLAAAIEPLTRIVDSEEESLEDHMARDPTEERRAYWEREHARREPAWQSPSVLLEAADAVLAAMRADPGPWIACGIVNDEHYTAAWFAEDLGNLRNALQWAIARQIPRVRLEIG